MSSNFTKQTRSNVQFNVGTNTVGANSVVLNQMADISFGNYPQPGAGLALAVNNTEATGGDPAGIRMLVPSESNNSLIMGSSCNDYLTELYNNIVIDNTLDNQVIIGQEESSGVRNFTILGTQGTSIYTSQQFGIGHSDLGLTTSSFLFNISGENEPPGLNVTVMGSNVSGGAEIRLEHIDGNGIVIDDTGVTITGLTGADSTQITSGSTTISTIGGVNITDEATNISLNSTIGLVTVSGLQVDNFSLVDDLRALGHISGDTLGVDGLLTGSDANFSSGHISGGSLDVAGFITGGNGANFSNGHISGGSLDVAGLLTGNNANFSNGHISGGSLDITNNAAVGGTLTVTGNSTFSSNLTVEGNLTILGESTTTTTVANELDICDNIIRLNYGGAIRDAGIIFDEVTSGQTDVCGVADTGAASLFFDAAPGSGGFVLGFVNSTNGASMTDTSGDRFELINVSGDLMDRYCDLIVRNVTAKEVSQVSDRALKKDIEEFENGLDLISNMRPVKYHWNNEPENAEKQFGFVAQELEEVVPSIVNSTGDVKSVAYPKITSILVQAVKEQQKQIDDLRARLL